MIFFSFLCIESSLKTQSPPSFRASAAIVILQARWSAAILMDTGQRKKGLWLNCHSLALLLFVPSMPNTVSQVTQSEGVIHKCRRAATLPLFYRRGIVWTWGEGGCCSCLLPQWSGSKPRDPELSESLLLFTGCGGKSQKHLPSLKREKLRANHVELEQLPHNHDCAFSDIIKMHWALKQASMDWLCSRGKWTLKMKQTSSLSSYLLYFEVSLD